MNIGQRQISKDIQHVPVPIIETPLSNIESPLGSIESPQPLNKNENSHDDLYSQHFQTGLNSEGRLITQKKFLESEETKIKYRELDFQFREEEQNIGYDIQNFNIEGTFDNQKASIWDFCKGKVTLKKFIKGLISLDTLSILVYGCQYFCTLAVIIILNMHLYYFKNHPDASIMQLFVQNSKAIPFSTLHPTVDDTCPSSSFILPLGYYTNLNGEEDEILSWKGYTLCTKLSWDFLRSPACPENYILCTTGRCYNNGCPITDIIKQEKDNEVIFSPISAQHQNSIYDISIIYGTQPCLDPTIIPISSHSGCGKFGRNPSAQVIDSASITNFEKVTGKKAKLDPNLMSQNMSLVAYQLFSLKDDGTGFCSEFERSLKTYSDIFNLKYYQITYGFLILSLVAIYATYILSIIVNCYYYKIPFSLKFLQMENDTFYFYPAIQVIFLIALNIICVLYYRLYMEKAHYLIQGIAHGCYMQKEVSYALASIINTIEEFCSTILMDTYSLIIINGIVVLFFLIINRKQICRTDGHVKLHEEKE